MLVPKARIVAPTSQRTLGSPFQVPFEVPFPSFWDVQTWCSSLPPGGNRNRCRGGHVFSDGGGPREQGTSNSERERGAISIPRVAKPVFPNTIGKNHGLGCCRESKRGKVQRTNLLVLNREEM